MKVQNASSFQEEKKKKTSLFSMYLEIKVHLNRLYCKYGDTYTHINMYVVHFLYVWCISLANVQYVQLCASLFSVHVYEKYKFFISRRVIPHTCMVIASAHTHTLTCALQQLTKD